MVSNRRLVNSFTFLLCFFTTWIVLSMPAMGLSSLNGMVVIPQAVIPEKGTTEYGLTQQMYEISDQEIQTDTNFSFEVSLSDRLEYGLSVYDETNMVMGISAQVSRFETADVVHNIAAGYKNLGYDNTDLTIRSMPYFGPFCVYSLSIPVLNSSYHIGVADYLTEDYGVLVAGANYSFSSYTTTAEWDGKQVHFGVSFHMSEELRFVTTLTPVPYKEWSDEYQYVSFSLRYEHKPVVVKKQEDHRILELQKEQERLNAQLLVLNAKTDVVREFSSLDFLEEFEQFLVSQHRVEKELDKESKSTVRSALFHMQQGLELYYNGHYDMAKHEYLTVITLLPDFSMGYARLGSIYYKLGDLVQARYYWDKALELDPDNDSLRYFLHQIDQPDEQLQIDVDTILESQDDEMIDFLGDPDTT